MPRHAACLVLLASIIHPVTGKVYGPLRIVPLRDGAPVFLR